MDHARAASAARGRAGGSQHAKQAPSVTVRALRKRWEFAAACQFLFTFDEALRLNGFQTAVCCATTRGH